MEIHFKIIGVLFILLAIIHIPFPRYFKWNTELSHLSLINKQMMQTHAFFIALTVFLMGLLCLTSYHDIIYTAFGKKIALALGLFWFCRLIFQLFIYSPALWKGKKFETFIHIIFTFFWIYVSFLFMKTALPF
jgi:hypothetical protein